MKTELIDILNAEFSGHMAWEIGQFHMQIIRDTSEGDIYTPEQYAEYPGNEEAAEAYDVEPDNVDTVFGWWARLSAPGYMDCTEWIGPFESADDAGEELLSSYAE